MNSDYDEGIPETLRAIMRKYPEVEGIALVTTEGSHIASVMTNHIEEERINLIAASVAEFASLGAALAQHLGRGELEKPIYLRATSGCVIIRILSDKLLLVYICKPDAILGRIFVDRDWPNPPIQPTPEPIFPWKPPGRLTAHAKPDYDDPR